jgi:hypothetical protein
VVVDSIRERVPCTTSRGRRCCSYVDDGTRVLSHLLPAPGAREKHGQQGAARAAAWWSSARRACENRARRRRTAQNKWAREERRKMRTPPVKS